MIDSKRDEGEAEADSVSASVSRDVAARLEEARSDVRNWILTDPDGVIKLMQDQMVMDPHNKKLADRIRQRAQAE